MPELFESYFETAEKIGIRIQELYEMSKSENNEEKRLSIIQRRKLLIDERYDMLEIAASLRDGVIWGDFY